MCGIVGGVPSKVAKQLVSSCYAVAMQLVSSCYAVAMRLVSSCYAVAMRLVAVVMPVNDSN